MIYNTININGNNYDFKASFLALAYYQDAKGEDFVLFKENQFYDAKSDNDNTGTDTNGNTQMVINSYINMMDMMYCSIQAACIENKRDFNLQLTEYYRECSKDLDFGTKLIKALYKEFLNEDLPENKEEDNKEEEVKKNM
ncbi:hypothetical protein GCQ56_07730 [Marinifilum sp. N1E240]|uniref:hypothetical protein n=1 Tax=Marinifilum sp. N1E240 TaxID=2608082 RepID=UPI00128B44F8|nr:hypothetical protein [Marinifilum sp. N1E240]MPQ46903.1 hypothetical protein [Marinifilum sp. N1E240]